MRRLAVWLTICFLSYNFASATLTKGDVTASSDAGFHLVITRDCDCDVKVCEQGFVRDIQRWWLADHTYSGKSQNLAFNFSKRCLEETLPGGGFVRHMEVTQYMPGKRIVLTGGMGPLQEMGIHGAMTIQWILQDDNQCQIKLSYKVSGYSPEGLKDLAPIVDSVLSQQMDSFKKYVDQGTDFVPPAKAAEARPRNGE